MMRFVSIAAFALLAALLPSGTYAQPREFSYQAAVKNASGSPIADGNYNVTVRLYDVSTGGTELYNEKHEVAVKDGILNLYIGSITPLPISLPLDRELFLGLSIADEPELQPRTKILAAPVALFATQAWEAQRLSPTASGVVKSLNELSGAVRIIGDSTLSLKQIGNVIQLHVEIDPADGVRSLASPDQTLSILSSTGPNVLLDVADGAITTNKLANGAVTGTKISQLGALTGQVLKWDGSVWKPANDLGLQLVATSTPLSGDGTPGDPIAIAQASSTMAGYLTSADWNLFNAKLSAVSVTPRLSGNGTAANPLDLAQQGAATGEILKWNGTSWSPAADQTGLTTVSTDATLSGNGTAANQLKIAQQGATNGQVLKWNGTTWLPAADAGLTSVAVTARLTGNGTTASPLDIAQQGATTGQILKWNGTTWLPGDDVSGLTAVSVRSPELSGTGTSANPIILAQQGATNGQVLKWNGTSWSPAADAGLTTVAVNSPLTGNGTTSSPISIPQANSSTNGYLSSTDWTTFNNKLSAVAVTARLTGNGTTANPLDIAQQGATTARYLPGMVHHGLPEQEGSQQLPLLRRSPAMALQPIRLRSHNRTAQPMAISLRPIGRHSIINSLRLQ